MVKAPVAGAVKTRLAREVGVSAAVRFARQCASALFARIAYDRRWHTTLCVTPDVGIAQAIWPRGLVRTPQGNGDLGRRMQRIFRAHARGPLVVIGTDIPHVRPSHIAAAFRALGRHEAVLGPADDGGYWLIGLRRRPHTPPHAFARVRWSSAHALADTLASLAVRPVALVATLSDVDDGAALARHGDYARRIPPASR